MRVEMKTKKGNEWVDVETEKLLNKSVAQFIADEFNPTMAAVYKGDKREMFVVNNEDLMLLMEEKGPTFLASDILDFLGTQVAPAVVAHTFPESSIIDIRKPEHQKELDV